MTDRFKFEKSICVYPSEISKAAEDLFKRVLEAQEQSLKDNIEHNTVVLNGNKYGYLKRPGYTPMLFGMKLETANMPDDYDFMLMNKLEPYIFRSNADRIRSMSDEELADWLTMLSWYPVDKYGIEPVKNWWVDWLKRDSEEWKKV